MAANSITQHSGTRPWCDPVELAGALEGFLFLSAGAHPEARRSVLALAPAFEVRIDKDGLVVDGQRRRGNPLQLLDDLAASWKQEMAEDGFTGGLAGYLAYEFLSAVEPTLPAVDGCWGVLKLFRDALVFDHEAQTVRMFAADLAGETDATTRLEAYRTAARVPVPGIAATPSWGPGMDLAAFSGAVETLRDYIHDGDLFQANLATRFSAPLQVDGRGLLSRLRAANPSPYMALLDCGDHAVVSGSPEQLFAVEAGRIRARPIAGTRPRGASAAEDAALEQELLHDAKEQAEHTMLVDLVRNDIARVATAGTVRVPERMSVERYQHVMHLVSRVEARVREGSRFGDWLAALFPGGTITGAPKHRACQRIAELEPVPRGPYTGSAGWLSWSHNAHWNILIRTMVLQDGVAHVHAGSGIVADSKPHAEWAEAGHKAQSLLNAALAPPPPQTRLGETTLHGSWAPPVPTHQIPARVLLIDNYDSFAHNLADYCAAWGSEVQTIRNDEDWQAAMASFAPTHVILGPGPGHPADSGATLAIAAHLPDVPVLGVCLGHQALGLAQGADIRLVAPVHGKTATVSYAGLFGQTGVMAATRYHSLVTDLPADWVRLAWLEDGMLMAMKHPTKPVWGLQFHPESLCTDDGLEWVGRFLATQP